MLRQFLFESIRTANVQSLRSLRAFGIATKNTKRHEEFFCDFLCFLWQSLRTILVAATPREVIRGRKYSRHAKKLTVCTTDQPEFSECLSDRVSVKRGLRSFVPASSLPMTADG